MEVGKGKRQAETGGLRRSGGLQSQALTPAQAPGEGRTLIWKPVQIPDE